MKIEYRVGNLLDHPGRFLLHGCNAQGVMGSGVAKAIRDRYPVCFTVYNQAHQASPLKLGQVVVADCGVHLVFNGITQQFYGGDGAKYVDYQAIERVIEWCDGAMAIVHSIIMTEETQNTEPLPELAMPLIGAGLAGGDWKIISEIIEKGSNHFQPVVYVLNQEQLDQVTSFSA